MAQRLRDRALWGAVGVVAVAGFLFSRIGIDGHLYRDEAIYAYGGIQLSHGVPPYVSIFDPKGPLATFIAGIAAWFGHGVGVNDLTMIRAVFFAICILTALATYLLVLELWGSVLGAVTAGIVFTSFRGYAQDALRGPDAHAVGPIWALLSMWLALRRQWYWAAFAGSLASLVKQTYGFYVLAVIVTAAVFSAGERWQALRRAIAGALTPLAATFIYFALTGAVGKLWEAAIFFPVRGLKRAKQQSVLGNAEDIAKALWRTYNFSGILFGVGLLLLFGIAIVPIIRARRNWRSSLVTPPMLIVGLTLIAQIAYLLKDYVSFDDLYQLLPYAAMGFGGAVSFAVRRLGSSAVRSHTFVTAVVVGLVTLIVLSSLWFTRSPDNDHGLHQQRAMGCAINKIVPPGTFLYAVGDPVPLVLTGRRNPDRYIYLASGVAPWKIEHTRGGMKGWKREVVARSNSVIILQAWNGAYARPLLRAIRRAHYRPGYVGTWRVFVGSLARDRAKRFSVRITSEPTKWPMTAEGKVFSTQRCGVS